MLLFEAERQKWATVGRVCMNISITHVKNRSRDLDFLFVVVVVVAIIGTKLNHRFQREKEGARDSEKNSCQSPGIC